MKKNIFKKKRSRFFFKYFIDKIFINTEKRFIYFPIYWSGGIDFYSSLPYNAYQNSYNIIKYKYYNYKYCRIIEIFKKLNKIGRYKFRFFFKRNPSYIPEKINILFYYIYVYNIFFSSFFLDVFYFFKQFTTKKQRAAFYVLLNFIKNKLFINLYSIKKKNYLFLSSGLFIRFFEKRKSFKKNKTVKLLMAKYLRKLILLTKIRSLILIVKKLPTYLLEFLNVLNTPIAHKFVDPVENVIIEEKSDDFLVIKFLYFIFLTNKDFSKNKIKKKGRIKRKIFRKLIIESHVID